MTKKTDTIVEKNGKIPAVLSGLIADAQGLLWQMKRSERRLEFLHDPRNDTFADLGDLKQLLTDLVYAKKLVKEDDFFRFKLTIKDIREGQPAFVLFRIREKKEQYRWLKVTADPGKPDNDFSYGLIQDITADVTLINQLLEKDLARQTMLQRFDFPALLVDMKSKAIISRNSYAYSFFGYNFDEFNRLTLKELYAPGHESKFIKAYETCFMEGVWEGPLQLAKKDGEIRQVMVHLKRLIIQDLNLLRITIPERFSEEDGEYVSVSPPLDKDLFLQQSMDKLADKESIADILSELISIPYGNFQIEALLYLDVHAPGKKDNVHAVGTPFAHSDFTGYYNFEGSIMQDILERRVEHVILEDTLESTRSMDWALFIPNGIRSYFVKPYFYGSNLRSLLFFCSTEVGAFSEKKLDIYTIYHNVFFKALRKLRKRTHGKPKT